MEMAARQRLGKNDWCSAALAQIAEGGTASVSVEGLARRLGVTKGSGYWHFTDRADLIRSSLDFWAEEGTSTIVEELASTDDPRERLRTLLRESFDDERAALDARLATVAADPEVTEVVERVTAERVTFLNTILRELGLSAPAARRRAALIYASYLGHVQLAQVDPDAFDRDAVVNEILNTLAPPPRSPDPTGRTRRRATATR